MVVNPKKYQEFALSATEMVLRGLFKASVKLGSKIAGGKIIDCIEERGYGLGREEISKTIYYLKRSKYIIQNSDSVLLTDRAKIKIIDEIASNIPNTKRYHLISFDIPEQMKSNRNRFRRTLKRIGFVQVQKSLWAIKKEVGELVEIAAKENKVGRYIAYFKVENSNISKHLEKIVKD